MFQQGFDENRNSLFNCSKCSIANESSSNCFNSKRGRYKVHLSGNNLTLVCCRCHQKYKFEVTQYSFHGSETEIIRKIK